WLPLSSSSSSPAIPTSHSSPDPLRGPPRHGAASVAAIVAKAARSDLCPKAMVTDARVPWPTRRRTNSGRTRTSPRCRGQSSWAACSRQAQPTRPLLCAGRP
ncbi:unnamed protein product, partial [Prorocentrum cordatum]